MRNIFSIGTKDFKKQVLSNTRLNAQKKLLDILKIAPELNITGLFSNTTKIGSEVNPNLHSDIDINGLKEYSIDELLDLSLKICEPYLIPKTSKCVFRSEYEDLPPNVMYKLMIEADYEFSVTPVNNKLYLHNRSVFDKSVKIYLLLSALYTCSMLETEARTHFYERLIPLGLSREDAIEVAKMFSHSLSNANKIAVQGKKNPRFNYFKFNALFDKKIFSDLKTEKYYESKRIDEVNPSRTFNRKTADSFTLESYYDFIACKGIVNTRLDKTGNVLIANEDSSTPLEVMIAFIQNFIGNGTDSISSFFNKLGNRLIAEYEVERLTNINLILFYADKMIFYDKNKLGIKQPEDNLINDTDFLENNGHELMFYPLLRLRLSILNSLFNLSAYDCKEVKALLKHQTANYFPLIDCIFHILLKIKYHRYSLKNLSNHLNKSLEKLYYDFSYYQEDNVPFSFNENDDAFLNIAGTINPNTNHLYLFNYDNKKDYFFPIWLIKFKKLQSQNPLPVIFVKLEIARLKNMLNAKTYNDNDIQNKLQTISFSCKKICEILKKDISFEVDLCRIIEKRKNALQEHRVIMKQVPTYLDDKDVSNRLVKDFYKSTKDFVSDLEDNLKCLEINDELSYLHQLKNSIEHRIDSIDTLNKNMNLALQTLARVYPLIMPQYFESVYDKNIAINMKIGR